MRLQSERFDGLAARARANGEASKQFLIAECGGNWALGGLLASFVDFGTGFLCFPSDLTYFGCGAGTFAGNPTEQNAIGLCNDIAFGGTVFLPTLEGIRVNQARAVQARSNLPIPAEAPATQAPQVPVEFRPGPHATDSIPLRGPQRDFRAAERAAVDAIGATSGCHTCGATTPGTKSGSWIIDHQPVSKLNSGGLPQRGFPQCKPCSCRQGGLVSALLRMRGGN